MAIDKNTPIFDNVSFSDLVKHVYNRKLEKDIQVYGLIEHLKTLINDPVNAGILVPLVKEYLDISVKNDEIMVKLCVIIQKLISTDAKGGMEIDFGITAEEKKQLLDDLKVVETELKNNTRL